MVSNHFDTTKPEETRSFYAMNQVDLTLSGEFGSQLLYGEGDVLELCEYTEPVLFFGYPTASHWRGFSVQLEARHMAVGFVPEVQDVQWVSPGGTGVLSITAGVGFEFRGCEMRLWLIIPLSGCLTVDGLLPFHNETHCSEVSEETCENEEVYWDKACTPCDQDYDWDGEIPWREMTVQDHDGISVNDILGTDDIRIEDASLVTRVPFESEDGEAILDAYFLSSNGRNPELANTTIVYSHGNKSGIEHYLPRVAMLHALGSRVYYWDYRGYGKSMDKGSEEKSALPTLVQWVSDARLAYEQARSLAPDSSKMIIYGKSLGGFPGMEQADVGEGSVLKSLKLLRSRSESRLRPIFRFIFPVLF